MGCFDVESEEGGEGLGWRYALFPLFVGGGDGGGVSFAVEASWGTGDGG